MNQPPRRRRRLWLWALPVLVAGYVAWFFVMLATAESRVRALCSQVQGMPLAELQAFAAAHGMWPRPGEANGTTYFVEGKTMGRFGCTLVMEGGVVKSATYKFND